MDKITQFKKIKGHKIFKDFAWQSNLDDFSEKNVIYGWNGSGKTTLSNIFRAMEKKQNITEGEVTIAIGNTSISGSTFASSQLPKIRVFNRDFVENSVFKVVELGKPTTSEAIYVLGEDSAEKQKQLEGYKAQLQSLNQQLTQHQKTKSNSDSAADGIATDTAKTIKDVIQKDSYINYDKRRFKTTFQAIKQNYKESILNEQSLTENTSKMNAKQGETVSNIVFTPPDLNQIALKTNELLSASITSQVIDSLQQDTELSAWVEQGLGLVKTRNTSTCFFCEQVLPPNRIPSLEAHYNDAYTSFKNRLTTFIQEVSGYISQITQAKAAFIDPARFYEHLQGSYKQSKAQCDTELQKMEVWLSACKRQLEAKATNLFQSFVFQQEIPVFNWQGYASIANCVRSHNQETTGFLASVTNARKAIEHHHVAGKCEEYNSHCQSAAEAQKQITNITQQITTLNNSIISLEKDIVSHREPAESLNESLKKYLPYCELKFDIKDNGYVIKRGDQVAKDLSEGEKTTIAFLYFLQSLEDKDFKIAEGIVVIDDPVSSLDSNCLHQTFSLLKNRLSDCKQLFIMTHNFYFYRNVKEWTKHYKAKAKKYFLNTLKNNTGRYSTIEMASKSLVQHESEYHYLFEYIHKAAHDEESNETIIFHAPNAARRLLESFLSFKKPMYAGRFYEQLKQIDYDEEKKTAIYRLVLINSHHEYVSTLEEEFISIPQTKEALKYLLGLIKKLDEEHFNDMVQTFSPQNSSPVLSA